MKIIPGLNKEEKELLYFLNKLIQEEIINGSNCPCANCRIDKVNLEYIINNYTYDYVKDKMINVFDFMFNTVEPEDGIMIIYKQDKELYLSKKMFTN